MERKILSIQWSQDEACFALGTEAGFSIWNSDPVQEVGRREIGGIQIVSMLHRCSLLALTGGGREPFEAPNKVVFWDDVEGERAGHIEFRQPVRAICRRQNLLIVATVTKVFTYFFPVSGGKAGTPFVLEQVRLMRSQIQYVLPVSKMACNDPHVYGSCVSSGVFIRTLIAASFAECSRLYTRDLFRLDCP
eukprot:m.697626 g.697626  ORF g.697626 m.697626 type:complete len:191 (+) comp22897_c0_seq38:235-807(+)